MPRKARYSDWNKRRAAIYHPAKLLSEFEAVAKAVGLERAEYWTMLGVSRMPPPRNWKTNRDKLDRMALLIRIFDLAGIAIPGKGGAQCWLRHENPATPFKGLSPLGYLLENKHFSGLFATVEYLEALTRNL